eukprot:symbB.v1.2.035523.t1/scaffold4805.1/size34556/1
MYVVIGSSHDWPRLSLFIFGCVALEFISKDQELKDSPETGHIVETFFSNLPRSILTLTQFVTLDSIAAVYYPLILQPACRSVPFVDGLWLQLHSKTWWTFAPALCRSVRVSVLENHGAYSFTSSDYA